MVQITEIELGLLLPKMGRKVFYSTLILINSIKQVSKKLILKVSDIYISFEIYIYNYCF